MLTCSAATRPAYALHRHRRHLELTGMGPACPHKGDPRDIGMLHLGGRDYVVTASSNGSVTRFRIEQDEETGGWVFRDDDIFNWRHGHTEAVSGVEYNADKGFLASAGEDAVVNVWNTAEDEPPVWSANEPSSVGYQCVIYPSADTVLTGGGCADAQLKVWDIRAAGRKPQLSLREPTDGVDVCSLAVPSLRPEVVATGCSDGSISIWDTAMPGKLLTTMKAHAGPVWSLRFNPHAARFLFSGGGDGQLMLWDFNPTNSGGQVAYGAGPDEGDSEKVAGHELWQHDGSVLCVDYSADARLLLSGGDNGCLVTLHDAIGSKMKR